MGIVNVGIDCAPCSPRPDTYIGRVVELLGGVEVEPYSKMFGAWEWEFKDIPKEKYLEAKPLIKKYMDDLYETGKIRGAQWFFDEEEVSDMVTWKDLGFNLEGFINDGQAEWDWITIDTEGEVSCYLGGTQTERMRLIEGLTSAEETLLFSIPTGAFVNRFIIGEAKLPSGTYRTRIWDPDPNKVCPPRFL